MSKQVIWSKLTLENFISLANLNDFQEKIMRTRCQNMTVVEQSLLLHCSESKIHKEIARIKKIYDAVQAQHPDELPERKKSAKELFLDTH